MTSIERRIIDQKNGVAPEGAVIPLEIPRIK